MPEHLITGDRATGDERLIGGDTGVAAVIARAQMVARNNAPVLPFGETGTGKEIIARAIHEDSAFRGGPFRRVDCGAIALELIDSEILWSRNLLDKNYFDLLTAAPGNTGLYA